MTLDDGTGVPTKARAVLSYFLHNPQAADSLEGIARWRVRSETIHHTVDQVDEALRWLVERGYLVREIAVGMAAVFRLNPARAADARGLVEGDSPGEGSQHVSEFVARREETMSRVVEWLDARLYEHTAAHPPGEHDMPGLALSHSSILELLAPASRRVGSEAGPARRTSDAWAKVEEALNPADPGDPLAALRWRLGLSRLELQAVLLSLAPEIDVKYQRVLGVLNDDLGRRGGTLGLLCSLLGDPPVVRIALEGLGGLCAWRLLESGPSLPRAEEAARLDPALVGWLMGSDEALLADPLLVDAVARVDPGDERGRRPETDVDPASAQLAPLLSTADGHEGWVLLAGPDSEGWSQVTRRAAAEEGRTLLRVAVSKLKGGDAADPREVAVRVGRAVRLLGAVPVLDVTGEAPLEPGVLAGVVERVAVAGQPQVVVAPDIGSVVGVLPREGVVVLRRDTVEPAALANAYGKAAADAGLTLSDEEAGRLATSFPFSEPQIDEAARLAALERAASGADRTGALTLVSAACRRLARRSLPRFARQVDPVFTLDDVVLPVDRHDQLREIVAHVRHSARVLHEWGFSAQLPYGRGVSALFCGASGTGKTMAAQAIASALETETYVVDLAQVVSKYVGESERNLNAVFTDAERGGAVLVFDEADALFGKRSEVKDAHDRYANIEVAYLLQRMEEFQGLAILTTNLRRNLDDAFLRRLRFVVDFPKPGPEARDAIWRKCLPGGAPQAADVGAGLSFLARRLDLTGGNIRQITLRAAFAAADEGSQEISVRHLVGATRAELKRLGMLSAERDLAAYEAAGADAGSRVA